MLKYSKITVCPFRLQLSENDLLVNSNQNVRPVVVPKSKLVLDSIGYAEVMNAGKSRYNEDQSCIFRGQLWPPKVIYQRVLTIKLMGNFKVAPLAPFVYICSLLSNTQVITKQNGSKSK